MSARTTASYLITSIVFTISVYGVSFLLFHSDYIYFVSLLSLGYLNLFVSALLANFLRRKALSRLQKTFSLSAIVILAIVESNIALGLSPPSMVLSSTGTLRSVGVGVYQGFSSNVSSIDWGILAPGSETKVTVFMRNEGNTEITLHLSTENWNPESAPQYISLSWDYDGNRISPEQIIQTTLSLYVSESIEGITHFTFDIIITAAG